MSQLLNWTVLIISLGMMFYAFRKPPLKDWIIIFLLKAFITTVIDSFLVAYDMLSYPVRFFPHVFKTTVLFDLITFPILCVLFNQTTHKSNIWKIIIQAILFSGVLTLFEVWAEKNTDVIKYNTWRWYDSFIFLTITFLFTRAMIALIRKRAKELP